MAREWTSRPPGTKSVRVDVAEDVHAKLRVKAARAGKPMSAYVRDLVLQDVADEPEPAKEKGRPRKSKE